MSDDARPEGAAAPLTGMPFVPPSPPQNDGFAAARVAELAGRVKEAEPRYRALVDAMGDGPSADGACACVHLAAIARVRCDRESALERGERARRRADALGETEVCAEALNAIGAVHQSRGDFAAALRYYSRILSVTTSPRPRGLALQNLGAISSLEGKHEAAEAFLRESARYFQAAGWPRGAVLTTLNRTRVRLERRRADTLPLAEAAFEAVLGLGEHDLLAAAALNVADACVLAGQPGRARESARAALRGFVGQATGWAKSRHSER